MDDKISCKITKELIDDLNNFRNFDFIKSLEKQLVEESINNDKLLKKMKLRKEKLKRLLDNE